MATERQITANRENAKKSTGPKTPEGRAAVRLNSLKHGLSAKALIVMGEKAADLEAHLEALVEEHQPATLTEMILVRQLAIAAWRQLRLFRQEAGFYYNEGVSCESNDFYQGLDEDSRLAHIASADVASVKTLAYFHRVEVRLERTIRATLEDLGRHRAARLAPACLIKAAKQTQSQPTPFPVNEFAEPQPLAPNPDPPKNESTAA